MSSGAEPTKSFDDVVAEERKVLSDMGGNLGQGTPFSALCISGGGIRSATFGLGAIQGLADRGVLENFDYLSTVSGGGYIGGWLTSWKHRAHGLTNIVSKLGTGNAPPKPNEPDPIGYLRQYNNYLSPRLGLLSADSWTLAATVLRNMTLNWLVIVPLLMCALMVPRLLLALGLLKYEIGQGLYHSSFVFPMNLAWPLRLISAFFFAAAIFNTMRYLPGVGGKNHSERDFLWFCLTPLVLASLAFLTYDAWFDPLGGDTSVQLPSYFEWVLWFVTACAAGWIGYLILCRNTLKRRFQLLIGPLSLAILLMGTGTASAAYILVMKLYPDTAWPSYITFGPPLLLLGFMVAGGLYVGLSSHALGEEDREWFARGGAWLLLFVVGWTAVCGLVLLAPLWLFSLGARIDSGIAGAGGLAGWLCALGGFSSKTSPGKETARPKADKSKGDAKATGGMKSAALDLATRLAAPVFVVVLLAALAILTNWLMAILNLGPQNWTANDETFLADTRADYIAYTALAFFAIGWIAARFININKFSLNAMYRNRLIRAYLGASNNRSKANKFIGFSETDNIHMGDLTPELKPFHIVNITLNLVGGRNLAWQQRMAESFTVSPLHTGNARLGYRRSAHYGGPRGISLGTAITISGAAVSPSMGYHSSGVIGFIMTLFNARLGAWLGNPGKAGRSTWRQEGPNSAIGSLVKEAFGMTDDTCEYVYLSDGGHFENLGIYEMVMRRCRRILVLDSGCDPEFTFEDLGNALRKIRIDMGISIEFQTEHLNGKHRWAYATIPYSRDEKENGMLVYLKPMMVGDEPPDVMAYHNAHLDFPHQSTANQFYDESQTESYRMLGLHSVRKMCEGWDGVGGLAGLFDFLQGTQRKAAGHR